MNNIALMRERSGFTQRHVAQKLKIDRSAISKWEDGENFPRAGLLPKLAALYGCQIEDLYDRQPVETG